MQNQWGQIQNQWGQIQINGVTNQWGQIRLISNWGRRFRRVNLSAGGTWPLSLAIAVPLRMMGTALMEMKGSSIIY